VKEIIKLIKFTQSNLPSKELHPGPPFIQIARGAVSGEVSLSKSQKKRPPELTGMIPAK
jgi:hypothetical protein